MDQTEATAMGATAYANTEAAGITISTIQVDTGNDPTLKKTRLRRQPIVYDVE